MKLIDRKDIEDWARRIDSKSSFPTLVSRLVHASTPKDTFSEFPDGSSTFVGGWDGKVECSEKTSYVPQGTSLWEFGTEKGNNAKAEEDYIKRKANPIGEAPEKSTYIFATPSFWRDKDKWRAAKIEEHFWADIKVYDSRNLEEWIDKSPAVSRWFSTIIKKYPADGIQTTEDFWKEWSIGPKGILSPAIVTAGRERESKLLLDFLNGKEGIKAIKGTSKDEVIAFIIATAQQFSKPNKEVFFSKSLIIDTTNNFRSISSNQNSLNLISRIEETKILFRGVSDGHHVIVPLGGDDTFNSQDILTLPTIDRDGQIEALKEMGIDPEEAAKLSREAGRNISILKRLLDFPDDKFLWATIETSKEIIPALLMGRWDENKEGDKRLIEHLSRESYSDYLSKLILWKDGEIPPIILIGFKWRLTSPLVAWINLSRFISVKDLDLLKSCFLEALREQDKAIDLAPDQRLYSPLYATPSQFSSWAREGLTQSMILVGLYGEGLKIPGGIYDQQWVDQVIHELLDGINGKLWASLNPELPLISEASPLSFLNAVSSAIEDPTQPIKEMFTEESSLIDSTSRHTGLLWALEGLAWMPQYFSQSVLLLSKLSELDPGGKLLNRPINSLTEIFKPWHYQTLAHFGQRVEILKKIFKITPQTGWQLLIRLLPNSHSVGHFTHKMRWRMFNENPELKITYKEIFDTHEAIIDILLSKELHTESDLGEILQKSVEFQDNEREKVFSFIKSNIEKIDQANFLIWHQARGILSHHRSFPKAPWALSESTLINYQEIYELAKPTDIVARNIWMFNDHWPSFMEGSERDEISYEKQGEIIHEKRVEALLEIYKAYGIHRVIELASEVKEPLIFGNTLAYILGNDSEIKEVLKFLNENDTRLHVVQSFIYRNSFLKGLDWIIDFHEKLDRDGYSNEALANFLIPLQPSNALWEYLEKVNPIIQQKYWLSVPPRFWGLPITEKTYGILKLLKYKRFISAIDACYHDIEEIPSEILLEVLESASSEKSNEEKAIQGHQIERILKSLDLREDVDKKRLFPIEWSFLPILSRFGAGRSPKLLHEELSNNPKFFVDLLTMIYKPESIEGSYEEIATPDEQRELRAVNAYDLLHSWKRIPGTDDDGIINKETLETWINKARELAKNSGRLEVADMHIGQVLAQYKEDIEIWPPEEISSILDSINTNSIKSNFSAATSNKRGSSVRGPFEGGDIERGHSEFFNKMASKNRSRFPITAGILTNLAKKYIQDAKYMDQRAEIDKLDS